MKEPNELQLFMIAFQGFNDRAEARKAACAVLADNYCCAGFRKGVLAGREVPGVDLWEDRVEYRGEDGERAMHNFERVFPDLIRQGTIKHAAWFNRGRIVAEWKHDRGAPASFACLPLWAEEMTVILARECMVATEEDEEEHG